jgi:hypothetical protein
MFGIHKIITNNEHLVCFHGKNDTEGKMKLQFHVNKINNACVIKISGSTICSSMGLHQLLILTK